jgi:hypothetical protein
MVDRLCHLPYALVTSDMWGFFKPAGGLGTGKTEVFNISMQRCVNRGRTTGRRYMTLAALVASSISVIGVCPLWRDATRTHREVF